MFSPNANKKNTSKILIKAIILNAKLVTTITKMPTKLTEEEKDPDYYPGSRQSKKDKERHENVRHY